LDPPSFSPGKSRASFSLYIERDPPPDLQALIREHGDWCDVPPEAWARYRQEMRRWKLRVQFRA
jgi:hypothetical protein